MSDSLNSLLSEFERAMAQRRRATDKQSIAVALREIDGVLARIDASLASVEKQTTHQPSFGSGA